MSQRWSYGEIFETIEPAIPDDRPALVHGKRIILGEFKKRIITSLKTYWHMG